MKHSVMDMDPEDSDAREAKAALFMDAQLRKTRVYSETQKDSKPKLALVPSAPMVLKRGRVADSESQSSIPRAKRMKRNDARAQGKPVTGNYASANENVPFHSVDLNAFNLDVPLVSPEPHSLTSTRKIMKRTVNAATGVFNKSRKARIGIPDTRDNALKRWHRITFRTAATSMKNQITRLRPDPIHRGMIAANNESFENVNPEMNSIVRNLSSLSLHDVHRLQEGQSHPKLG